MYRALAAGLVALTLALPGPPARAATEEEESKPLGRVDAYGKKFKESKDLDLDRAVTVQGFTAEYDSMKLEVVRGTFAPRQAIDGRTFSAVFVGEGRFTFTPPSKIEADQLEEYTKERALDKAVTEGLFYFDDGFWERVTAAGQPATPDKKTRAALEAAYKSRRGVVGKLYTPDEFTDFGLSLTLALMRGEPAGFFVADVKLADVKKGKDHFTYMWDPSWREEVGLMRTWPYPLNPDQWEGESLCSFNKAEDRERPAREQAYEDKTPIDVETYVADYSIYKDANDDKIWLKADVEMKFTSRVDGLDVVRLGLIEENDREDLIIRGITADGTNPLPYVHQNGEIVIELPKPLAKGEASSIRFLYGGPIISVIVQPRPKASIQAQNAASADDKAALALISYGLLNTYPWFPQQATTRDRYTWDWTVRTQRPLEAAVSGTTVDEKIEGDFKVIRVKETVPSLLASIIVGRYSIFGDTVQLPDGRTVTLRIYSHPGKQSENSKDLLQQAKECLLVYSQYFGPYPYQELDLAQMGYDFGFAQAPPGLVQMTGEVYLSKTFLATFYQFRDPQLSDYFIPHEVAHQWWGHRVGWLYYRDQWISETLAEFSAALFMEVSEGEKGYADRRHTWEREGGLNTKKTGPLWLGGRNAERYQMTVYRRGPLLMDKLMKDLGREKLMLALRAMADLVNNNQAATEDLEKAFESAVGFGFEEFFRLYVKDNVDLNASPEDIQAIIAGQEPPSSKKK